MDQINVNRKDLDAAAAEGYVAHKDVEPLWEFLATRETATPPPPVVKSQFDLAHVAWYTGAVIVMLAASWLMWQVWDVFSGAAILATTVVYAGVLTFLGTRLWNKEGLRVPGGLLIT